MGMRLHIIEMPGPGDGSGVDLGQDPGAMWRVPDWDKEGREGWAIVLPNRAGLFFTTMREHGNGAMWDVTGTPPNITVSPSINAGDGPGPGNWHGHITDGVMTP